MYVLVLFLIAAVWDGREGGVEVGKEREAVTGRGGGVGCRRSQANHL